MREGGVARRYSSWLNQSSAPTPRETRAKPKSAAQSVAVAPSATTGRRKVAFASGLVRSRRAVTRPEVSSEFQMTLSLMNCRSLRLASSSTRAWPIRPERDSRP